MNKLLKIMVIAASLCSIKTMYSIHNYLNFAGNIAYYGARGADALVGYGLMAKDMLTSYKELKAVNQLRKDLPALYAQLEDAPQDLHDLTFSLAENYGISKEFAVKVNPHAFGRGAGALPLYKLILLDKNFDANPQDQQKAILAHELIHMEYNDQKNIGLVKTFAPVAMTAVCLMSAFGVTKFSHWAHATSNVAGWKTCAQAIKYGGKITNTILKSGLFQYALGTLAGYKYQRYTEKRADIKSAQRVGTAQGFINHLEKEIIIQKLMDEKIVELKNQGHEVIDNRNTWKLLADHPSHEERIDYLKPYVQQGKV